MDEATQDATQTNRAAWNTWLTRDLDSSHHQDVARFLATGSSLRSIEREELGDAVAGKTLLHPLCNMGSETLSWARLGATATGVDLSDAAIAKARQLASESGLPARFIQANVYDLPVVLDEQFDLVFMSYGALLWLADIPGWARLVARYLRPGGSLYLVDMHPFANMLAQRQDDADGLDLRVRHPYTEAWANPQDASDPELAPQETSDPGDDNQVTSAPGAAGVPREAAASTPAPEREYRCWAYGLGEVVSALIAAGLRLDYLHEFPFQHYQQFPALVRDAQGWWRWPTPANTLPLLFSLRATR